MGKQSIGIGAAPNDGTGDTLRVAFDKVNDNFDEVYSAIEVKGTDVVIVNPVDNSTDGSVNCCFIAGGEAGGPNVIGSTGKPLFSDFTPTGWANDTGYVTGAADVATIGGGYDHVNNQIAGTICGGGHNFIKSNSSGHSIIGGGSYNIIAGGRSGIFSGRRNVIDSTVSFSFIGGGDDNELLNDADYSAIVCGLGNEVSSDHCFIGAGLNCDIGENATYSWVGSGSANIIANSRTNCWIGAGTGNQITGGTNSAIVSGSGNIVSGSNSLAFGSSNTVSKTNAFVFGSDVTAFGSGITVGTSKHVETGDAQATGLFVTKARTTTTGFNTCNNTFDLPAGKVVAGVLKVTVIAMRDGSADANNDSDYSTAAWQSEVIWRWDGTNGYFATASATAGPSANPTINLTVIRDDITVAGTPRLAIDGGSLRLQVNGKATTTINWVARFEVVNTLVS